MRIECYESGLMNLMSINLKEAQLLRMILPELIVIHPNVRVIPLENQPDDHFSIAITKVTQITLDFLQEEGVEDAPASMLNFNTLARERGDERRRQEDEPRLAKLREILADRERARQRRPENIAEENQPRRNSGPGQG